MIKMSEVQFIEAQITHLNAIVELLYDDALGKKREALSSSLPESYFNAFQEILADPNATIIVGICDNKVIACAQLNFLRYLTYQGGIRGQIEGVRVHQSYRGKGIGHQLFKALT
jgi:GNAT superfamily N-acetyltransferase